MKKSFYEAPESELIMVRFEDAFLQGPSQPQVTTTTEDRDVYDFEEL